MKKNYSIIEWNISFLLIFFIFLHKIGIAHDNTKIEIDYVKASKNSKKYYQVPQNTIIWAKFQDEAPTYFYNGPLRGHGYFEAFENYFINLIRKQGKEVYVDYITKSKFMFYAINSNYEVCSNSIFYYNVYKKLINEDIKNNLKAYDRFRVRSLTFGIRSAIGKLGILSDKKKYIEQYKFPSTDIYSIKKILDDENLKTTMINGTNNAISDYIFKDPIVGDMLKKEYMKRIYLFVASDSIQSTLMLNGRRMDWVDLTYDDGYYLKQLKIPNDKITLLPFAQIHPSTLKKDDNLVSHFVCYGKNIAKIKKVMKIINDNMKNIRTNYSFWETVLKQFAKDAQIQYESPERFFGTRETFKFKKDVDSGYFDYPYLD